MRRYDLLDDLSTVATPRRPWPRRTGARPARSPSGWLAPLAVLAVGCIALAAI